MNILTNIETKIAAMTVALMASAPMVALADSAESVSDQMNVSINAASAAMTSVASTASTIGIVLGIIGLLVCALSIFFLVKVIKSAKDDSLAPSTRNILIVVCVLGILLGGWLIMNAVGVLAVKAMMPAMSSMMQSELPQIS